jgi:hypothetical protein
MSRRFDPMIPTLVRPCLVLAVVGGLCGPAQAGDALRALPFFAANPDAVSPWTGLHVGTDAFVLSRKGAKPIWGGDAFAGYSHEFANNIVVGIDGITGFTSGSFRPGPSAGYDFAGASVKVGYDMGRLMPFVTTSVALAKPRLGSHPGFAGATESMNDLLNGSSHLSTLTSVGAGFDYAITNRLSFELAVTASQGPGPGGVP